MPNIPVNRENVNEIVARVVRETPVVDMHTHLYPVSFGTPVGNAAVEPDPNGLMLWGVDELLTYHYLVAELFRVVGQDEVSYEDFWEMNKIQQADLVWKHLFVERSPVSESCRGVLTSLQAMGLDTSERDLSGYRKFFGEQNPDKYVDKVMEAANVSSITMTNAVFDDNERQRWYADSGIGDDPRFAAVLRFDPLILDWSDAGKKLKQWGYEVSDDLGGNTIEEVKRFLREWIEKIGAIYAAVSLPPSFEYPYLGNDAEQRAGQRILEQAILPVCAELGIPFAMMIGSERGVNPELGDAGDMGFKSDVRSVTELCYSFPDNRFFVTMLSRENQHELAVAARKFGNLMVFGCWWFLNNPSLIEEMTRMRVELLGTSFIPQHSDARVLDQLTYKWSHSRKVITKVLCEKYADLIETGWVVSESELKRDVKLFFEDNFRGFLEG